MKAQGTSQVTAGVEPNDVPRDSAPIDAVTLVHLETLQKGFQTLPISVRKNQVQNLLRFLVKLASSEQNRRPRPFPYSEFQKHIARRTLQESTWLSTWVGAFNSESQGFSCGRDDFRLALRPAKGDIKGEVVYECVFVTPRRVRRSPLAAPTVEPQVEHRNEVERALNRLQDGRQALQSLESAGPFGVWVYHRLRKLAVWKTLDRAVDELLMSYHDGSLAVNAGERGIAALQAMRSPSSIRAISIADRDYLFNSDMGQDYQKACIEAARACTPGQCRRLVVVDNIKPEQRLRLRQQLEAGTIIRVINDRKASDISGQLGDRDWARGFLIVNDQLMTCELRGVVWNADLVKDAAAIFDAVWDRSGKDWKPHE